MHGRRPAPRRPGRTRHWLLNRTMPDCCLDTGCLSPNHGVSLGWLTARDALSVGRCMHRIRHPTALPRVTDRLAPSEGMNPTRVDCRSRPRPRAETAPPSLHRRVLRQRMADEEADPCASLAARKAWEDPALSVRTMAVWVVGSTESWACAACAGPLLCPNVGQHLAEVMTPAPLVQWGQCLR